MEKKFTVLCAVLGKPDSSIAVNKAIDLALKHEARLVFASVLNAEFLGMATPVMTSIKMVYQQLRELEEFTMAILCQQAENQGVNEIDSIIREGDILSQLRETIADLKPDILVMGDPINREKPVYSVSPKEIDDFLNEIRNVHKVKVELIDVSKNLIQE